MTSTAANDQLAWADRVTQVALLSSVGQYGGLTEVQSAPYERAAVGFGPILDGLRQTASLLQFSVPVGATVAWYALLDADSVVMAVIPHAVDLDSNQPRVCFFADTTTGWVDAPDHTLQVGHMVIFMSGLSPAVATDPTAAYDPINSGQIPAFAPLNPPYTLPYGIAAQGPFWIWPVVEIETHRFRMAFYDGSPTVYVTAYTGWGYYQRIDQTYFDGGGTVTIGALRIAGYG